MKFIIGILLSLIFIGNGFSQGVSLPNPILFVAQVPIPRDSSTLTATFSNHLPDPIFSGRGSDLYIYYPDGVLKNITQSAGFGTSGFQGANSIGVRQPSMHWSGTKALFSMVIGAPTSQGQIQQYYWQIYEVTNFGENETPIITKIPNQPAYNNISPIYGTDERIIFTSDRPRNGLAHLYPLLDENFSFLSTTGLWSLDPASGNLFQMNISPSGAFDPLIDSYGRVVFTRWDHLQRDQNADRDAVMHRNHYGTFNYSDESATSVITSGNEEIYPEPEPVRQDLLQGTNLKGLTFDQLFPWQMNEDGTSEETLDHVGRHDFLSEFRASINDDTNVTDFNFANAGRINDMAYLQNLLQLSEDPTKPGIYYGVNISGFDMHRAAQIVSLTAAPTLDPAAMVYTYITDESTVLPVNEGIQPGPNQSGHYRNPLPLSNGKLLVVHTPEAHADRNIGTRSHPISRYDFRIKTMKKSGSVWVADSLVTPAITKSVSYWDPDTLVTYDGIFWQLDPVEVKARQKPNRRSSTLASPEKQIFIEEGIDETTFRNDLKEHDLALLVSRNVTHRDKSDHQQPYFLKVHNSETGSANPHGKIYDVAHLQLYQADQLRGLTLGNPLPIPGRRVLAQYMHDSAVTYNPSSSEEKPYTVKIASDGSFAAYVPPHRAITWALTDTNFTPVVRERYWVTTQPGEIRVCASCHGTNDEALVHLDPQPQNEPEALRSLLQLWKSSHTPLSTELISPLNDSANIPVSTELLWHSVPNAKNYKVMLSSSQDFSQMFFTSPLVSDTIFNYSSFKPNTVYFWRVVATSDGGDSAYSGIWKFTTAGGASAPDNRMNDILSLSNHPNPFSSWTTIDFTLPLQEKVTLEVFNLLGEEVATLITGYYNAGTHSFQWEGSNIPSGTYFFKLQTDEGIISREVQIVR
jgi:hypothetical protein